MSNSLWGGFWYAIWRFIVVSFGAIMGAISALLMLIFTGGRELATRFSQSEDPDSLLAVVEQVYGTFLFAASLGPALTVVPAIGAIVLGEVARIRSVFYYVIMGGLAALAIPFLYETGDGISGAVNTHYIIIFLACGFVGGFVYWLIAGRGS